MNNAEKFKKVFGIYATELWAMPEEDFLRWLNGLNEETEGLTEGRWIPVTERLPEEDGNYLVTFDRRYAEEYALDDIIGIAPFEVDCEGFGIWQESFDPVSLGSLGSDWVEIQVTAWRPLPEAFEVEEES